MQGRNGFSFFYVDLRQQYLVSYIKVKMVNILLNRFRQLLLNYEWI